MKKVLLSLSVLASISLLGGCATSTGKPVEVVDADRSAGTVDIGYVHADNIPLMDNGENARWDMAIVLADEVCKRWGYKCADELTPHSRSEGIKNAYGMLLNGSVTKKYMCLDKNCPAPKSTITELKK